MCVAASSEVCGGFHNEAVVKVAASPAPEFGDALIPHADNFVGLGTCRNFQAGLAVKGGDFQFIPQRCLCKTDGHLAEEGRTFALKDGMVLHPQGNIEVSGRATRRTVFAFARLLHTSAAADYASLVDPGWPTSLPDNTSTTRD